MPYKRGDKWVGKVVHQGKTHYCGTNHPTRRAALAAEVELRKELEAVNLGGDETCGSFAERWTRDYTHAANGRPRKVWTLRTYGYAIRLFARHPDFRDVPLNRVSRPLLMRFAREYPHAARAVRTMFADAYNDGLLPYNPASKLRIATRPERVVILTLEEMLEAAEACERAFPDGDYGRRFGAMFRFACWTGCRPGELAALRWENLRPDEGLLDVRFQRRADGRFEPPKNGLARVVILPTQAWEAVEWLPRRLDGLLFWSKTGRPMTRAIINADWQRVRAMIGRPDLDWYHATKHFCGSQLAMRGVPFAEVGWQLGHTDNGDTARRHYIHLYPPVVQERVKRAFEEAARDVGAAQLRGGEAAA